VSYARWIGKSHWYAYSSTGDETPWHKQVLYLTHCNDPLSKKSFWRYSTLIRADEAWVRKQYPVATERDVNHAIDIIAEFLAETDLNFRHTLPVKRARAIINWITKEQGSVMLWPLKKDKVGWIK